MAKIKHFYVRTPNSHIVNKWELNEVNQKRCEEWGYEKYEGKIETDENGIMYEAGFLPKETEKEIRAQKIIELQNFLNRTDWYVIRNADSGIEIPEDIKAKRQEARQKIDEIRAELEEEVL